MTRAIHPVDRHLSLRSNWLRAAVLGANDGILSTSSLVLGVVASGAATRVVIVAGIAGMAAGALSMAAGEYVSVSSQRDAERADLRLEQSQLSDDPAGELRELALISSVAACPRVSRGRCRVRCRSGTRLPRTPGTSSVWPNRGWRARCKRHGPPRCPSRSARWSR